MIALQLLLLVAGLPQVDHIALPDGGTLRVESSGKPSHNARLWTCESPNSDTTSSKISISESGASVIDRTGPGGGSGTFGGIRKQFYEGETVRISLSASNMSISFMALGCADGKPR